MKAHPKRSNPAPAGTLRAPASSRPLRASGAMLVSALRPSLFRARERSPAGALMKLIHPERGQE